MAQQPATTQCHQGRAMRYWVSFPLPHNLPRSDPTVVDKFETRAALCQIFDSIYLDVPMARVKFNVNTEYAYLQNFKILQSKFIPGTTQHRSDLHSRLLYATRH